MKRGAVNRVDSGDAEFGGSGTTEDSRLGTVCVNDLRAKLGEQLAELSVGAPVVERRQPALHGGDDVDREAALSGPFEEAALGAGFGSDDQLDAVAVNAKLIFDVMEGVFLGPSDNQSGDDVSDMQSRVAGFENERWRSPSPDYWV